ncbi:MAG: PKD domain-containing protein [Thermoplasmata archaeon]|nr:PKD domain-containing protein [Thermoplasmata archaeon]
MKKKCIQYIVCVGMLLTTFSTIGIPYVSADAPVEPSQPLPAQSSSGVTIFIDLHWTCGEANLTYDVYLGTENPPPLVVANQSETIYKPNRLLINTTYFWQIVAHNSQQEFTEGPIWSFATSVDQPPFQPNVLQGPTAAGPGISLNFVTVAPDPEGDQVYYQWNWGDGNTSSWLGPYAFGEHAETAHEWVENGSYDIKVRAKDVYGKESDWSSVYHISITPQIHFMNLKPGYVYLNFFDLFNKAYGYIYSLDLLGMALIISTGGFTVNATGSDAVNTVVFEMANRFFIDERWNTTSNNATGHSFQGYFTLTNGLYETTASAYDANGRLIDRATRQYVLYYVWRFNLINQLLGGK